MERLLAEQARIQQERNAAMAAQRQALIKRDEARRAQQREQEKSKIYYFLEPNRGLLTQAQPNFWTEPRRAGHPVEGAPAGAKVRIFGNTGDKAWLLIQVLRTGNESGYGDKYWVESPSVKVLGTETDIVRAELEEQERLRQEQERQAELARQQQARERQEALKRQQEEAARQAAERQAAARRQQAEALAQRQRQQIADFQEARRALHRLFWWFTTACVLLVCIPAYRLFAPHKLAEFGSWRVKGLFLLSCGGLTAFFRGMLTGESASVDSTYLAFWGGLLGIPALFFLPGAILLFFQFLHYLVVPHPAESFLDRARTSQGVALDAAKAAAESMYDPKRDGVFEAWRAQNRKRRLAAEEDMLRMENAAMEALMKQQQMKAKRSPPKETPP